MSKKPTQTVPLGASAQATSRDVLETAEMLRAAATLVRTSQGILFLSNGICSAEVFSKDDLKLIEPSLSSVLSAYSKCYSSLMSRYSALASNEEEENNRKKEVSKAGLS